MRGAQAERLDPLPDSVSAAWLGVADEILSSLNHALSNRMAALVSLVRVMEYGGAENETLFPVLQQEVDRLERTTALLRLLPRGGGEEPEPVRWVDLLPDVLALMALQRDLRDLPIEQEPGAGTAPGWGVRGAAVHALLIVLHAASRAAPANDGARVVLRPVGDDDWTGVLVEGPTAAEGLAPDSRPAAELAAAAAVMERALGELRWGDTGVRPELRVELRLPTLQAARRRGGGAGPAASDHGRGRRL